MHAQPIQQRKQEQDLVIKSTTSRLLPFLLSVVIQDHGMEDRTWTDKDGSTHIRRVVCK